jgi:hypothetical protein
MDKIDSLVDAFNYSQSRFKAYVKSYGCGGSGETYHFGGFEIHICEPEKGSAGIPAEYDGYAEFSSFAKASGYKWGLEEKTGMRGYFYEEKNLK